MTVVASNYARKENDLYQTEPWATEALLRHFPALPPLHHTHSQHDADQCAAWEAVPC